MPGRRFAPNLRWADLRLHCWSGGNARLQTLSEAFAQVSAAERDPDRLNQLFAEGKEAAEFIKTFVVQAELNDRGNYGELAMVGRF